MTIETFFEKFDQIADAPNALVSIRRLILDSAVRGTLVEQDPRDEPASILLERLETDKKRLDGKSGRRKGTQLPPIDMIPYELPSVVSHKRLELFLFLRNRGRVQPGLICSNV
jgi:type I restriction enzyme S subunit